MAGIEKTAQPRESPVGVSRWQRCRSLTGRNSSPLLGCMTYGVFFALTIVFFERFAFYGISSLLQNYVQGDGEKRGSDGAFMLPQRTATAIFNGFNILCSITSIGAAAASDIVLGMYKTILIGLCVYAIGTLGLILSAIPQVAGGPFQVAAFATGLVLLSIGVGAVKATIAAFLGDQLTLWGSLPVNGTSEESITGDRSSAVRQIFNLYFWVINLGCVSILAVPFMQEKCGFWPAFTLCLASIVLAMLTAVFAVKHFVIHEPESMVMPETYRLLFQCARKKFNLNHSQAAYCWDDLTVRRLQQCLLACRILLFAFVPMWLCYTQIFSNLISQAAQMNTHGLPNAIVPVFNAIACMLLTPVVQFILNALPSSRVKTAFTGPIARISTGFILSTIGIAYTAGVQSLIFNTGPCFERPLECPASANGTIPNDISFFLQVPVHIALALGEIFSIVTGLEYAYELAPSDMKAMVQAAFCLGNGLGSVAGLAFSPLAHNPQLVTMYSILASVMMANAIVVWFWLRKHN